MRTETTTPESTAALVAWMDECRVNELLADASAQVAGDLTETTVADCPRAAGNAGGHS